MSPRRSIPQLTRSRGPGYTVRPVEKKISKLDFIGRIAWGAPIIALPWFFGGIDSRSQYVLAVEMFVALGCCLIGCLRQKKSLPGQVPVGTIPLFIALIFALFQLLPLRSGLLSILGSNQEAIRSTLGEPLSADGIELGEVKSAQRPGLTLYSAATRRDLLLLLMGVSTFFLAARLFADERFQLGFFAICAVNGAALAFFGMAQQLSWNGMIYGFVPLTQGGSPFASYVCRTHAAGFLNLSLASAIGVSIWTLSRNKKEHDPGEIEVAVLRRDSHAAPWIVAIQELLIRGQMFLASLTGWRLFSFITISVISAGILSSLSRGAWIAVVCATLLTILAVRLEMQHRMRLVFGLAAVLLGLCLVSWLGRTSQIEQRLGTLSQQFETPDARLRHWRDGLDAAVRFLPAGSGLGTYRYVYPLFERNVHRVWYYHAENQYLEALTDAGLVGLGLIIAMIVIVGSACRRLMSEPFHSPAFACGVVGFFALAAQATHSLFDFGLYLPANMVLFAAILGITCGQASRLKRHRATKVRKEPEFDEGLAKKYWRTLTAFGPTFKAITITRTFSATALTALIAGTICSMVETSRTSRLEAALNRASRPEHFAMRTSESIDHDIAALTAALESQTDDAQGHLRLAQLWMARYRARKVEQGPAAQTKAQAEANWEASAPIRLHARASVLKAQHREVDLEDLRNGPFVQTDLGNAARHLLMSRRACPLIAPVHLMLAELSAIFPSLGDDQIHLARMRRVGKQDIDLLKECSLVELQSGRTEAAIADWKHLIELEPTRLASVLRLLSQQLGMIEEIDEITPRDPTRLVHLADEEFGHEADKAIREKLVAQAAELLEAGTYSEHDELYLYGMILVLRDNKPKGIDYLTKAVSLRPEALAWRYRLSLLLRDEGQLDAAHEHAVACARLEPGNEQYQALLKELIRLRLTAK